jgi:hypothetical protein
VDAATFTWVLYVCIYCRMLEAMSGDIFIASYIGSLSGPDYHKEYMLSRHPLTIGGMYVTDHQFPWYAPRMRFECARDQRVCSYMLNGSGRSMLCRPMTLHSRQVASRMLPNNAVVFCPIYHT